MATMTHEEAQTTRQRYVRKINLHKLPPVEPTTWRSLGDDQRKLNQAAEAERNMLKRLAPGLTLDLRDGRKKLRSGKDRFAGSLRWDGLQWLIHVTRWDHHVVDVTGSSALSLVGAACDALGKVHAILDAHGWPWENEDGR